MPAISGSANVGIQFLRIYHLPVPLSADWIPFVSGFWATVPSSTISALTDYFSWTSIELTNYYTFIMSIFVLPTEPFCRFGFLNIDSHLLHSFELLSSYPFSTQSFVSTAFQLFPALYLAKKTVIFTLPNENRKTLLLPLEIFSKSAVFTTPACLIHKLRCSSLS